MYFSIYPTTIYGGVSMTDLTIKMSLISKLKNNVNAYSKYIVHENEVVEDVAHNLYGDVSFHWIVLMMNDMVSPLHDWVMSDRELTAYINDKYPNPDNVHHYIDSLGYVIPEGVNGATPITNKEYEESINEEKREIKLLKPEFIPQLIEEFREAINNV